MKLMDTPGGRKIHTGYIPSMGGIGFVAAAFISILIWFSYENLIEVRYLLAAFGLMFFVGLRDDMVNLSALQKMGAQVVAALMVIIMSDIRITGLYGFMGVHELPLYTSYGLTLITIIGLTNAFNLIDGLDGLAGSISLVSFVFLGWWFMYSGYDAYAYFSFALVGGVLSFLIFNWHPAKIFMGDTGSLSLGFALSILTVLFIDLDGTMIGAKGMKFAAPIATGVALLIVPIYDTLRVFLKRAAKGKSPMSPDKSHVHHFLLRMGLRHDQVTLLLVGVKLFFIGIIFLAQGWGDNILLPAVLIMAVLIGLRLDTVTLRRVKKINAESPPVLVKREKKKPQVHPKMLRKIKINEN
ncbi:Undecaprenyl-phosphate N-acetylglucosaminyl 1-phosphate transferase [Indibacter alkaliphilus LW1]|uniref:Undecaprenyl-phosphate N-acetylglucosaminyl 1-phosphate transferase n=1 Tax=Indibacter alkaliphilus (strain CCUG 57479 / KCTC 22604 / LW1) TaxID=1189612 RepID=S2DPE9_INDAL|nr:MraY family glycosyltransferase [Indibacter alkaliphilus]EOZ93851.1 Undecaprenyl-phosphate N-acetylglucosaminyl 1-phosphate transferase [Indibacter alkaliphilus LW1]